MLKKGTRRTEWLDSRPEQLTLTLGVGSLQGTLDGDGVVALGINLNM